MTEKLEEMIPGSRELLNGAQYVKFQHKRNGNQITVDVQRESSIAGDLKFSNTWILNFRMWAEWFN